MIGPHHVMVATPCYGGVVTSRYLHAVLGLVLHGLTRGVQVSLETLSHESLITRARNALVARFLDKADATHLLFVDADIAFQPVQLDRMLALDEDIVAGMYPLKSLTWDQPALARAVGGEVLDTAALRYVGVVCEDHALERRDGFVTGSHAGTGFMLIKRSALLRMTDAYPQTRYTAIHTAVDPAPSPHQYALFDCSIDPATGHYLSEDYTFCQRWRAIGGRIWLDPQGVLTHVGAHDFAGSAAGRIGH